MELTYEIGHEVLGGKFSARAVVRAIKKQPSCTTEILVASATEILETRADPSGIRDALDILRAVAKHLDRHAYAPRPRPLQRFQKKKDIDLGR